MKSSSFIFALIVWAGTVSTAAYGAVINLSASKDNTIYSNDRSNSTGQGIFVGTSGSGITQRGLIAFDLSNLAAGSVINSVTLTMYVNAEGSLGGPETLSLNALSVDWGEGSTGAGGTNSGGGSGVTPSDGDATWSSNFYNISLWNNTGGDFSSTVSASTVVDGIGFVSWSGLGLVNDVQNWFDNGDNFGWIIRGNELESGSSKRFSSRENTGSSGANVPLLTLDYTPGVATVPVPAAIWLFGSGLLGLLTIMRNR